MFDIEGFLKEIREKVIFYRRDFHKYTELAWREFRTSSLIGKYLLDMGCSIKLGKDIINGKERLDVPSSEVLKENYERALQEGAFEELSSHMIGGYTGVVGILKNGERNKVALRFDIDGVTVKESEKTKHIPFKEGFLLKMMMLFQPGEENVCGGKPRVQSNILKGVDYLLSGHIGIKARKSGEIICGTKGFLAKSKINAEFIGRASHAATAPEKGNNALLSAATAILNLDAIPRNSGGITRINVGKLVAGSGRNVIPGRALMEIETRGESPELNDYMERYAIRILESEAKMHDNKVYINSLGKAISGSSDKELVDLIKIYDVWKQFIRGAPL